MILKITQPDSDANNPSDYFNVMREKNYEASFDGVKNFITENKDKLRHRRWKKPVRKWQWALAVLFPVLVVLACTKTERTEAVGQTIVFSVPVGDGAGIRALEPIIGGYETVISPDRQKSGHLTYTTFIPVQNRQSADVVLRQLKVVKGITILSTMALNAQVRESLLSQLGSKIFSTHIDAADLTDEEMQTTVNRQLREQGFNHISVTVTRNEKGDRTIELHPGKEGPNIMIDVSVDEKGTKMVLQEEKEGTSKITNVTPEPQPDVNNMTDAQLREYIRHKYGSSLRDEAIKITRTAREIAITIKQSDKREEIMRFKLN